MCGFESRSCACGGIGNARILRLSKIATNSPVGSFLYDHPTVYQNFEISLDKEKIDPLFEAGRVMHALEFSNEFLDSNNISNLSVEFRTDKIKKSTFLGKSKPKYFSKATLVGVMEKNILNRVFFGVEVDPFLKRYVSTNLKETLDFINFNFNWSKDAKKSWHFFSEELLKSKIGRTNYHPNSFWNIFGPIHRIHGGGHLMGTTIMGHNSQNSVVDNNCKVHDTKNLYVAGSSVFPSIGIQNPTFTIVALALRLAEHITPKV